MQEEQSHASTEDGRQDYNKAAKGWRDENPHEVSERKRLRGESNNTHLSEREREVYKQFSQNPNQGDTLLPRCREGRTEELGLKKKMKEKKRKENDAEMPQGSTETPRSEARMERR